MNVVQILIDAHLGVAIQEIITKVSKTLQQIGLYASGRLYSHLGAIL